MSQWARNNPELYEEGIRYEDIYDPDRIRQSIKDSRDEMLSAWKVAHDAAVAAGAPDPRACADRYIQGLER